MAEPQEVRRVGYGHPDALRLIAEVQAEYVVRYGGPDETPLDPLMFEPPAGSFYVGYLDGVPVATGAWRRSTVEAFGKSAAAHGAEAVVPETGLRQPEAIALYESAGYLPVPAFGYYKDAPLSRCYGRRLVPVAG
ncbi:MAG: GNAT family N-acetyltransferase [Nocardioides sp.]|nr:GNAT family N-acetyltransferase [Nocardioides sp.]